MVMETGSSGVTSAVGPFRRTALFSFPIFKPSKISLASSEWPTSSNASVAS